MTTPPRIARAEVDAALRRIAARRRKIDDEGFALVAADDPVAVLDYLRKGGLRLPEDLRWVAQADVSDGLVLHVWEWWEARRRERALLTAGVRLGVPLSQLGAPLGIGSGVRSPRGNPRRGVKDRMDRLDAVLEYDRPDASITREARRVEQDAASGAEPQAGWFERHAEWISSTAAALLAYEGLANEEAADYLEEVRRDWLAGVWTPASLAWMGLATGALRASPQVLALDARAGVHRALKNVEKLRTAFASLADPA